MVAHTTAKVIPLHEHYHGQWTEQESLISVQENSHYNPDLITSVRFSKTMYDTYQLLVRENAIYRNQVREMESTTHELKEAQAMIKTLKKGRRKDKAKILELRQEIQD